MAKPDGGPAHPFHHLYQSGDARESYGMSLRQWYAGHALGSYIAMHAHPSALGQPDHHVAAEHAVKYADALLAELERE